MSKRYDVVAVVGSYRDREGNEKPRYMNCGAVFCKDGKFSMKLDSLPVGEWNGWFSLFEPRQEKPQVRQRPAEGGSDELNDGIPF